ncbi:MAG: urease accessory protein UreE [Gammaproteobacteria bacterium]
MLHLTAILGNVADPALAERLHELGHHGGIEYVSIAPRDVGRRRLRVSSDRGTDCAIALAREQRLTDGAVLLLEQARAIVARLGEQRWLTLRPRDQAAAVELGYHAGNLHWKVRFAGADLLVALDGPLEAYTARLASLTDTGRLAVIPVDDSDA